MTKDRIPLADAVLALRQELETAARRRHKQLKDAPYDDEAPLVPALRVKEATLEAQVTTEVSGAKDGRLKMWVLTAGTKSEVASATTQKITLRLAPESDLPLGR